MSIAIRDLPDVIKIIVLLNISKKESIETTQLKRRIDRVCANSVCFETRDVDRALDSMELEGLIRHHGGISKLTEKGAKLSYDWRSLLLKREPILEVVAGLTDGSITGLVVILSAIIANLHASVVVFAAFLTLASVAITNFSSFLLGGITEDISDMMTLRNLVNYSLDGIPDSGRRDRSLRLVKELFDLLHKQISRSNLYAAVFCSTTTFIAGFLPIAVYLTLPDPYRIVASLSIVGALAGVFLVRYRSKRTKVHWKVSLLETIAIISIAVVASILLGVSAI
jgi:VIT1/CCC1 family predicted Fe2+/Mn2+ transporter